MSNQDNQLPIPGIEELNPGSDEQVEFSNPEFDDNNAESTELEFGEAMDNHSDVALPDNPDWVDDLTVDRPQANVGVSYGNTAGLVQDETGTWRDPREMRTAGGAGGNQPQKADFALAFLQGQLKSYEDIFKNNMQGSINFEMAKVDDYLNKQSLVDAYGGDKDKLKQDLLKLEDEYKKYAKQAELLRRSQIANTNVDHRWIFDEEHNKRYAPHLVNPFDIRIMDKETIARMSGNPVGWKNRGFYQIGSEKAWDTNQFNYEQIAGGKAGKYKTSKEFVLSDQSGRLVEVPLTTKELEKSLAEGDKNRTLMTYGDIRRYGSVEMKKRANIDKIDKKYDRVPYVDDNGQPIIMRFSDKRAAKDEWDSRQLMGNMIQEQSIGWFENRWRSFHNSLALGLPKAFYSLDKIISRNMFDASLWAGNKLNRLFGAKEQNEIFGIKRDDFDLNTQINYNVWGDRQNVNQILADINRNSYRRTVEQERSILDGGINWNSLANATEDGLYQILGTMGMGMAGKGLAKGIEGLNALRVAAAGGSVTKQAVLAAYKKGIMMHSAGLGLTKTVGANSIPIIGTGFGKLVVKNTPATLQSWMANRAAKAYILGMAVDGGYSAFRQAGYSEKVASSWAPAFGAIMMLTEKMTGGQFIPKLMANKTALQQTEKLMMNEIAKIAKEAGLSPEQFVKQHTSKIAQKLANLYAGFKNFNSTAITKSGVFGVGQGFIKGGTAEGSQEYMENFLGHVVEGLADAYYNKNRFKFSWSGAHKKGLEGFLGGFGAGAGMGGARGIRNPHSVSQLSTENFRRQVDDLILNGQEDIFHNVVSELTAGENLGNGRLTVNGEIVRSKDANVPENKLIAESYRKFFESRKKAIEKIKKSYPEITNEAITRILEKSGQYDIGDTSIDERVENLNTDIVHEMASVHFKMNEKERSAREAITPGYTQNVETLNALREKLPNAETEQDRIDITNEIERLENEKKSAELAFEAFEEMVSPLQEAKKELIDLENEFEDIRREIKDKNVTLDISKEDFEKAQGIEAKRQNRDNNIRELYEKRNNLAKQLSEIEEVDSDEYNLLEAEVKDLDNQIEEAMNTDLAVDKLNLSPRKSGEELHNEGESNTSQNQGEAVEQQSGARGYQDLVDAQKKIEAQKQKISQLRDVVLATNNDQINENASIETAVDELLDREDYKILMDDYQSPNSRRVEYHTNRILFEIVNPDVSYTYEQYQEFEKIRATFHATILEQMANEAMHRYEQYDNVKLGLQVVQNRIAEMARVAEELSQLDEKSEILDHDINDTLQQFIDAGVKIEMGEGLANTLKENIANIESQLNEMFGENPEAKDLLEQTIQYNRSLVDQHNSLENEIYQITGGKNIRERKEEVQENINELIQQAEVLDLPEQIKLNEILHQLGLAEVDLYQADYFALPTIDVLDHQFFTSVSVMEPDFVQIRDVVSGIDELVAKAGGYGNIDINQLNNLLTQEQTEHIEALKELIGEKSKRLQFHYFINKQMAQFEGENVEDVLPVSDKSFFTANNELQFHSAKLNEVLSALKSNNTRYEQDNKKFFEYLDEKLDAYSVFLNEENEYFDEEQKENLKDSIEELREYFDTVNKEKTVFGDENNPLRKLAELEDQLHDMVNELDVNEGTELLYQLTHDEDQTQRNIFGHILEVASIKSSDFYGQYYESLVTEFENFNEDGKLPYFLTLQQENNLKRNYAFLSEGTAISRKLMERTQLKDKANLTIGENLYTRNNYLTFTQGFAGTGKTFVIKALAKMLGDQVIITAPQKEQVANIQDRMPEHQEKVIEVKEGKSIIAQIMALPSKSKVRKMVQDGLDSGPEYQAALTELHNDIENITGGKVLIIDEVTLFNETDFIDLNGFGWYNVRFVEMGLTPIKMATLGDVTQSVNYDKSQTYLLQSANVQVPGLDIQFRTGDFTTVGFLDYISKANAQFQVPGQTLSVEHTRDTNGFIEKGILLDDDVNNVEKMFIEHVKKSHQEGEMEGSNSTDQNPKSKVILVLNNDASISRFKERYKDEFDWDAHPDLLHTAKTIQGGERNIVYVAMEHSNTPTFINDYMTAVSRKIDALHASFPGDVSDVNHDMSNKGGIRTIPKVVSHPNVYEQALQESTSEQQNDLKYQLNTAQDQVKRYLETKQMHQSFKKSGNVETDTKTTTKENMEKKEKSTEETTPTINEATNSIEEEAQLDDQIKQIEEDFRSKENNENIEENENTSDIKIEEKIDQKLKDLADLEEKLSKDINC